MSVGSMLVRSEPASAAQVRHQIADELHLQGLSALCIDDVMLVVTELVANAVVHAGRDAADADIGVAWDVAGDDVTVRVEDHSHAQPLPRQADRRATDGRGLAIVAALASEWGVTCAGDGKQVWARIRVRPSVSDRQPT